YRTASPRWVLRPVQIFTAAADTALRCIDAPQRVVKMDTMTEHPPPNMAATELDAQHKKPVRRRRPLHHTISMLAAGMLVVYALLAYLLMPLLWEIHIARHPS